MEKGITAYDEKDGDITDSLVIESVYDFLEKGRRLVSYAAFDRDGHVAKASRQLIYTDYHSPKISCAKPFSFPVGTQDILDSVYATDCIDGDISNKVEITGDSVFFLNIAGEYEIWLQVTNSCGDMVTVPVTLEMVDYRQQTERTKRAEAENRWKGQSDRKATEETGRKRRKEQKMEQRRGEYRMDGVDRALSYTVLTDVLRQWLVIFCFAVSAALLAAAVMQWHLSAILHFTGDTLCDKKGTSE